MTATFNVTSDTNMALHRKQTSPFSLLRWTGTSLLMLLLSSSVDSLRKRVGSFCASQSATLLSDAIIAACSVLKSLALAPPLPAPLFLERDRGWSGVNFETWSLMVTFPGEVLSNSMVKEAWPWANEKTGNTAEVTHWCGLLPFCFTKLETLQHL